MERATLPVLQSPDLSLNVSSWPPFNLLVGGPFARALRLDFHVRAVGRALFLDPGAYNGGRDRLLVLLYAALPFVHLHLRLGHFEGHACDGGLQG